MTQTLQPRSEGSAPPAPLRDALGVWYTHGSHGRVIEPPRGGGGANAPD